MHEEAGTTVDLIPLRSFLLNIAMYKDSHVMADTARATSAGAMEALKQSWVVRQEDNSLSDWRIVEVRCCVVT